MVIKAIAKKKKNPYSFFILCFLFTIRLGLTVIHSVLCRESWIAWECLAYIHSINVIILPLFPRPRPRKLFLSPLFCLNWILASHFCWAHWFGSHAAINVLEQLEPLQGVSATCLERKFLGDKSLHSQSPLAKSLPRSFHPTLVRLLFLLLFWLFFPVCVFFLPQRNSAIEYSKCIWSTLSSPVLSFPPSSPFSSLLLPSSPLTEYTELRQRLIKSDAKDISIP